MFFESKITILVFFEDVQSHKNSMSKKENCTFTFISINTEHWLRSVFLCGTQLRLFQYKNKQNTAFHDG